MKYKISNYIKYINSESESYIINTASGERCNISESKYNDLINYQLSKEDDLIKDLSEKNILFHNDREKEKYINSIIEASNQTSKKRPILYGICLSYDCNLKCSYCYEKSINRKKHTLTKEELDKAFESIFLIHKQFHSESKKVIIVLFGGEPFVEENNTILYYFFKKTIEAIEKFKVLGTECKLTLFTNGLNYLSYSSLIVENKNIIDSIMLTLNGPKDYHDALRPSENGLSSFEKTVDSIDFSLSEGIPVNVRMDINKNSLAYLDQMANFVIAKKWNRNNLFRYYISPIKWTNDDTLLNEPAIIEHFISKRTESNSVLHEVFSLGALRITHNIINLLNQKKFSPNIYHCETVRGQQYVLGSDGFIYRCLVSIGKCNDAFGRFLPKLEVFNDINSKWVNRSISNLPKCKTCSYAFICAGGCAYIAKEKTGNSYNPICSPVDEILSLCAKAKAHDIEIESYGFYYE